MLDEFRGSGGRKWKLRDITGFVVEFSGDQHGSRFIRNEFSTTSSEERQSVFDEIVPDNTLQLLQDVFGNYVIQKLHCLPYIMEGHVLHLSSNLYGCCVVQKAIESILPDQQASFVRELEPDILRCVKDSNGNHSFKRCLQHLHDVQTRPLLDESLLNHTAPLMQDQFGNYVIQVVIEDGRAEDKALVVAQLRGCLLFLALDKFASNVCEKALICADPKARRLLIDEIMAPPSKPDGPTPIVTMMKDQYVVDYVLQRALRVAEGDQKEALINTVRPQLMNMRRYSNSKHLTSIERELEKLSPSEPAR
ncbi:armadillo-type protein [Mycena olivaceomarginata]|nr:armadillo-type protein [Mycena olivaceomarginata]